MEENKPILYPIALPNANKKKKSNGGGGLACAVGNCFANTNGKTYTMTPSPFGKGGGGGSGAMAIGDREDKENSNIEAAMEGIRAMKEVLSRNNSAHELDIEVTSRAVNMRHNHVKPPRRDTPPSKVSVLAKIDNVLSESAKVTPLASQASSGSSAFTLQDEVIGSLSSTPRMASHLDVTPPKKSGTAGFIDMGTLHSNGSSSITFSNDATPVKDCDRMLQEMMGSSNASPKSPTTMLAHSLYLKAQDTAPAEQRSKSRSSNRVQVVASLLGAVALFTVTRLVGGGKRSRT
ncbi:hypothetical protein HOP50_18g81100 [Chloropicon primus]|nr:hypothetical protein HOP50_18g81100 [Chloropicon primus]